MSEDAPPVDVDHGFVAHASTKGSCPTPSSATATVAATVEPQVFYMHMFFIKSK